MRRKFSLFTLVLIVISLGTAVYLPFSLVLDIQDKRDELTLHREKRILQYLRISESLYRAGADKELTDFLKEIHAQHDVSYIAIYKAGQLSYVIPNGHPLAAGHKFEERAPLAGKDLIDETRSERSEFLSDQILLTIGVDKRMNPSAWELINAAGAWKVVLQDILTVIALAALAFWVHGRDLIKLRREIEATGRVPVSVKNLGSLSAESEAIIAGFRGYASAEKDLRAKHDRLSSQVLPALKRELFSGLNPPYTFDCTLVRTDINGFSQIFNSDYRERFAEHIDEFFVGLTEIASRYDGLIYEFVGDEAIYYFKDIVVQENESAPASSINRAIDAVRDIHALAHEIGVRTNLEGHRFTVKSALAHGKLRFAKQVDGYSLSGGVLIETVRILSNVTDKNENRLYYSSRHDQYVDSATESESIGEFNLKGYSEQVVLRRVIASKPVSTHLSAIGDQGFEFVSRYRNDFSLQSVIGAATQGIESWSLEKHLALIHKLRLLKVYRTENSLGRSLAEWIQNSRMRATRDPEWNRVVSAIAMLYPALVPKASLSASDIQILESLLDSGDTRTVANVIDVLTNYEVAPVARPMKGLAVNENNRIAANALIHSGTRDLSTEIIGEFDKMIFGRQTEEGRRSSGIYALGETGRILRARDPVYFSTRVDFHRLVKRVEPLIHHANESIATQAARALVKCYESDRAENILRDKKAA